MAETSESFEPRPAPRPHVDRLAVFEGERGRLFGLAYRMLASVSEAEDVLQDAWLRWHAVDLATVERPAGFLVSLVTRLCLDNLKAARNRLTDYVGPWLPEPLVRDLADPDPAALHEQEDDLSFAFLLLLERLSPAERAVFLLR
ncbi:MAG TPA: sigma factor, partial [Thermoanaerobaculia bacterium]|nr:sigma factor [Thermoanaerobaculia bacterium]